MLAPDVSCNSYFNLFVYLVFTFFHYFIDTTSTSFQPLLLAFEKIHYITVKAFFRLLNEMEASVDDFPKVSALVRSQLKFALRDEVTNQLYEFEKDLLEVEYKAIKDR